MSLGGEEGEGVPLACGWRGWLGFRSGEIMGRIRCGGSSGVGMTYFLRGRYFSQRHFETS